MDKNKITRLPKLKIERREDFSAPEADNGLRFPTRIAPRICFTGLFYANLTTSNKIRLEIRCGAGRRGTERSGLLSNGVLE